MNDYIDFIDEVGISEIRCMICNIPVRILKEDKDGKEILQPLGHYKEIKVGLSEDDRPHSVANIIGCKDCYEKPIDIEQLMSTIRFGWNKEMKYAKIKKEHRDKYFDKMRKVKIKKRLNEEEA